MFPLVVRSLRWCSPSEPLRQALEAGTLGPRHIPDDVRPLMEARARDRAEPLRRTLERLQPEARTHFTGGCHILADEARRTGGEPDELCP